MESVLSFFRMQWVHEPADRAVASWTAPVLWRFRLARLHCQSAGRLAHSKTWRGLQRFMESPDGFDAVHWDHELRGGCSAGVLACEFTGRLARCSCWRRDAAATRRRDGCAPRFMERLRFAEDTALRSRKVSSV